MVVVVGAGADGSRMSGCGGSRFGRFVVVHVTRVSIK